MYKYCYYIIFLIIIIIINVFKSNIVIFINNVDGTFCYYLDYIINIVSSSTTVSAKSRINISMIIIITLVFSMLTISPKGKFPAICSARKLILSHFCCVRHPLPPSAKTEFPGNK